MRSLTRRVKGQLEPKLVELKEQIRASPAVQMDETGWREDAINGYVWCACTPQVRYYEYHIARKISGGTRSPEGSETRMGLFSLFGTWAAQGLNPFLQCLAVFSQNQSLPQM